MSVTRLSVALDERIAALRGCRIEGLSEARARGAGVACSRSGTSDIVDATWSWALSYAETSS